MSPLRVVIADDQPMMRAGFKAVSLFNSALIVSASSS